MFYIIIGIAVLGAGLVVSYSIKRTKEHERLLENFGKNVKK